MSIIRLSSNCSNCSAVSDSAECTIHHVKINEHYTCDSFSWKTSLTDERQCGNCSRYGKSSCAHPSKASEDMLCSSWAPLPN